LSVSGHVFNRSDLASNEDVPNEDFDHRFSENDVPDFKIVNSLWNNAVFVVRTHSAPHNVPGAGRKASHCVYAPLLPGRRAIYAALVKRLAETATRWHGRQILRLSIGCDKLAQIMFEAMDRPRPLVFGWRVFSPVFNVAMSQGAVRAYATLFY
jgi:hypothetical protein